MPCTKNPPILTSLFARSTTGELNMIYTSHYRKSTVEEQMYMVIVANGKAKKLGGEKYRIH